MIIQVNTDMSISGDKKFESYLNTLIKGELHQFDDQINRIEVHLDEGGSKNGDNDKRCMLEARLENSPPVAATSHGNTVEQAVSGALDRLKTSIDRKLKKSNAYTVSLSS